MKKWIIVLVLWSACVAEAICDEKVVSIATLNRVPYSGKFLPNYGIVPELISAAYEREGYNVAYNFMTRAKVLEEVEKGTHDAAADAYYTKSDEQTYRISDVCMESPVVFYKQKKAPVPWNGALEDLKSYRIGVVKEYVNSPEFDKADFLDKKFSETEMQNIKTLISKHTNLILLDKFVGDYLINKKLSEQEKDLLDALSPPLYVNKVCLMFSRKIPDAPQKLKAFNSGLEDIIKDGTLKRILAKYGVGR